MLFFFKDPTNRIYEMNFKIVKNDTANYRIVRVLW